MPPSNTTLAYLATAAESVIVALTVAQIASGTFTAVCVWEVTASTYLASGFVLTWRRTRTAQRPPRTGVLDTLSWVLPIAASAGGLNAAILVLGRSRDAAHGAPLSLLVGASGIIVSWLLLHSGFAQVYETLQARSPRGVFRFPETDKASFADFLYLSFTIGTTFATSDANICTSRARLVVMVHSIVGFLYNALVVAIAFQVLQELAYRS